MHTLRLKLKLSEADKALLDRRFRMVWHMHNELVKHMQHRLNALERDCTYKSLLAEYQTVIKEEASLSKQQKPDKSRLRTLASRKKTLSAALSGRRAELLVSKAECESYVKVMQKRFKEHISSQQAQKEADFVWQGVEKVLFGNGRRVHLKKLDCQMSVQQKSPENGIKFRNSHILWCGMDIPVKVPDTPYIEESLNHKLSYCIITRRAFRNGWHYYVVLYLEGSAPKKLKAGSGWHGIDPGMSTMCHVSETAIGFHELAPDCKKYNKQIVREQRLIDNQMRQANPDNYNPDGTPKKGRYKWVITKGCRKRKQRLKTLHRKKTEYTLCSHNRYLNQMLADGNSFLAEEMTYAGLAKRSSKKAERQDKVSAVSQKDGGTKNVRKFKKKRRFGKSVNDRSPARFLARAKQKAEQYGGVYVEIDTKAFRASQYNHETGEYQKIPLSQRDKVIGGHKVLRDPYSAFLIYCSDASGTSPDTDKCNQFFKKFLVMQDAMIAFTKDTPHPACFGY